MARLGVDKTGGPMQVAAQAIQPKQEHEQATTQERLGPAAETVQSK